MQSLTTESYVVFLENFYKLGYYLCCLPYKVGITKNGNMSCTNWTPQKVCKNNQASKSKAVIKNLMPIIFFLLLQKTCRFCAIHCTCCSFTIILDRSAPTFKFFMLQYRRQVTPRYTFMFLTWPHFYP